MFFDERSDLIKFIMEYSPETPRDLASYTDADLRQFVQKLISQKKTAGQAGIVFTEGNSLIIKQEDFKDASLTACKDSE